MTTHQVKREGGGGVLTVLEEQPKREVSLSDFPNEILEMIIGRVTCDDSKLKMRLVNRRWKRLMDAIMHKELPKWVPFPDMINWEKRKGGATFNSVGDLKKFMNDMEGGVGGSVVQKNPLPMRRIFIYEKNFHDRLHVIKRNYEFNYVYIPKLFTQYWDTITQVYISMYEEEIHVELARQLCKEVFKRLPKLTCLAIEDLIAPEWYHDEYIDNNKEGEEVLIEQVEVGGSVPDFKYLQISRMDDKVLSSAILKAYGHQLKRLEIGFLELKEYFKLYKANNGGALLPQLEELKLSNWWTEDVFDAIFAFNYTWHLKKLSIQLGKDYNFQLSKLLFFIGKFGETLQDLCVDVFDESLTGNDDLTKMELSEFPVLTQLAISYWLKENDRVWQMIVDKMKSLKGLTFLCRRLDYETADTEPFIQIEEGWDDVGNAQAGMSDIWNQFPVLQKVSLLQHEVVVRDWEYFGYGFVSQVKRLE